MKILFICSNLIGDTILSSGAIKYFIDQNKEAKLTFVVGPTAAPLLKNYNNIENIIIFKKRKFNLHWFDIFQKTYNVKWDIVVDFRSSVISYLLRNNKKYIFKKNHNIHHIEQLNSSFGFNCSNLLIPTSDDEKNKADEDLDSSFKHIVIFPGGNWDPKLWSADNFNVTMKLLLEKFHKIKFILVGSLKEKNKFYNELIKGIKEDLIIDLFGFNLTLTSAYMKKSDMFIGNDSGLMHLAVANKLRVISLFGPTDDNVYGPYGEGNIVVRTSESLEYFRSLKIDENNSYMNTIKPEIIIQKCEKIINDKLN
ncbi:MAG: glycosyltransferase family 9 protein [Pelagibacteraceae bacterium]|nr:glycosyltransferase family 9 protein [Pelagibacteraceae bacterium]MBT4645409.1 glycosyltransferase family 9 protein [Pelagibacteraceae bacterium]